jgi:hypothetical protein
VLKVMVSFMTIWWDVQAQAQEIKRRKRREGARVLGLDSAYVLGWEEKPARKGSQCLHTLWKQLAGCRSRQNQSRSALEQLRDLLTRLSHYAKPFALLFSLFAHYLCYKDIDYGFCKVA